MNVRHNDSPNIARNVLIAKDFPICFFAINTKGMFSVNINRDSGTGVRKERSNDIPVIPPSINPAGIRKLSSPKPAIDMPKIIKKYSFNWVNMLFVFFIIFLMDFCL